MVEGSIGLGKTHQFHVVVGNLGDAASHFHNRTATLEVKQAIDVETPEFAPDEDITDEPRFLVSSM